MATLTPKTFYRGQPGTSAAAIYTAPLGTTKHAILKEITACNTTSIDRSLSVFSVARGSAAAASCALLYTALVPAYTTALFQFSTVLEDGAFLSASVSASAAVTLIVSGVEKP